MGKGNIEFQMSIDNLSFDVDAFDKFIQANGVELYHYKAVTCSIGMVDALSIRSPNHDHSQCQNGYIYKFAGIVKGSFTNNSVSAQLTDVGILDGSSVNVTFPRYYSDNPEKQVYVQIFDRFYVKDLAVVVPNTQRVESNITGVDKLTYKAESVEYLIDANDKEYYLNTDFVIQDGRIKWVPTSRPPFDANLGKGMIYSIRYLYTPYFYVQRLVHEVRIAQKIDFLTNQVTPVRVPYQAILSREYFQQKTEVDDNNPNQDLNRTMFRPPDGSSGSR